MCEAMCGGRKQVGVGGGRGPGERRAPEACPGRRKGSFLHCGDDVRHMQAQKTSSRVLQMYVVYDTLFIPVPTQNKSKMTQNTQNSSAQFTTFPLPSQRGNPVSLHSWRTHGKGPEPPHGRNTQDTRRWCGKQMKSGVLYHCSTT